MSKRIGGAFKAGKSMDKRLERNLYRTNVRYDMIDEFQDKNIFNRDFKRSKKKWTPSTQVDGKGAINPVTRYIECPPKEKPKRQPKGVWK